VRTLTATKRLFGVTTDAGPNGACMRCSRRSLGPGLRSRGYGPVLHTGWCHRRSCWCVLAELGGVEFTGGVVAALGGQESPSQFLEQEPFCELPNALNIGALRIVKGSKDLSYLVIRSFGKQ